MSAEFSGRNYCLFRGDFGCGLGHIEYYSKIREYFMGIYVNRGIGIDMVLIRIWSHNVIKCCVLIQI